MIVCLNTVLLYFLLAILPGLVWLLVFLKRDNLPEPKMKVIQVFYLGMFVAIPTAFAELWLLNVLNQFGISLSVVNYFLIKNIFIIGLLEELFKFAIVYFFVLRNSCLDEPIDIPLYMIISALGFATSENILLFSGHSFGMITETYGLATVRFLGATLLHALCSGIIGVFLAWGFYWFKQRWLFILSGFGLGIIAHGLFDFFLESSIISLAQNNSYVIYPALLLIVCYGLLSIALIKIKKLKSVSIIRKA
jgi:RsiW-degrading membrane proteinase PrsW (M82 family)